MSSPDHRDVPPAGSRGPRRRRADDATLANLISTARARGHDVDNAQTQLERAVAARRAAIADLAAAGLSVRAIAQALEISTSTVQQALRLGPRSNLGAG